MPASSLGYLRPAGRATAIGTPRSKDYSGTDASWKSVGSIDLLRGWTATAGGLSPPDGSFPAITTGGYGRPPPLRPLEAASRHRKSPLADLTPVENAC